MKHKRLTARPAKGPNTKLPGFVTDEIALRRYGKSFPFFSYSYELPSTQPACFDNHTKCRGVHASDALQRCNFTHNTL
jgi:hypothetical protein